MIKRIYTAAIIFGFWLALLAFGKSVGSFAEKHFGQLLDRLNGQLGHGILIGLLAVVAWNLSKPTKTNQP